MSIVIRDSKTRYEICKKCPEFRPKSRTCKQCGCIMPLKTKIKRAYCPLRKW